MHTEHSVLCAVNTISTWLRDERWFHFKASNWSVVNNTAFLLVEIESVHISNLVQGRSQLCRYWMLPVDWGECSSEHYKAGDLAGGHRARLLYSHNTMLYNLYRTVQNWLNQLSADCKDCGAPYYHAMHYRNWSSNGPFNIILWLCRKKIPCLNTWLMLTESGLCLLFCLFAKNYFWKYKIHFKIGRLKKTFLWIFFHWLFFSCPANKLKNGSFDIRTFLLTFMRFWPSL